MAIKNVMKDRITYKDGGSSGGGSGKIKDPAYRQISATLLSPLYRSPIASWDGTGGEHDTSAGDLEDYGREEQKNNFATPEAIAKKKSELVSKSGAGSAPSQNVSNAMALLSELRKQQYADPYGKQLESLINSWNSREPFSYELENDPLFQMARDNAMYMGDVAMRDTIGKVTAMSGGYGNSYAQTAGQQAYNAYLQELNSQVPDFYEAAYKRYADDAERDLQEIALLQSQRDTDYGLWEDAYRRELDAIGAALSSENEASNLAWEMSKWTAEHNLDAADKGFTYDKDGNLIPISEQEMNLKSPTREMYVEAEEIYNKYGDEGLKRYAASLEDYDATQLLDWVRSGSDGAAFAWRMFPQVK